MPPMMKNATAWAGFEDIWLLGRRSGQMSRQTSHTDRHSNWQFVVQREPSSECNSVKDLNVLLHAVNKIDPI